jgi:hypothetical protein
MPGSFLSSLRSRVAVIAACGLLSACGGGGGGSATSPSISSGGSGSTSKSTSVAPATFSVSFQQYTPVQTSSVRRAQFVSPATQSVVLNLVSVNGATPASAVSTTVNIGSTTSGCSTVGAKVTCSATFNAPVGNDVLSAASFSGPNGTGTQLGTATVPTTVQSNATNVVALSIGGIIANLQMFLTQSSFTVGTAGKGLIVIVPLDASGAQIVNPGNYSPSIAVTTTDTSGAFSLILDGTSSGTSATVQSPSDQVVLSYSGASAESINITATAGTGISASVNANANAVSAPGLGSSISGNTSSTPNHFQFTALGQTGTLTVSGGTPPYTVISSDPTVASVSGSAGTYTITATGYGSSGLGTATLTISDSATPTPATRTESVTVLPTAIGATVTNSGSLATCTTTGATFPQTPVGGVNTALETCSVSLSGGNGIFTDYFATTGTSSSVYANATLTGSALTVTPTGNGNDTLIVQSGAQTFVYPIVTGSPFAASLPKAEGLLVENGTGKNFNLTLPGTVTSVTQTSGLTDNNLVFSAPDLSATPMTGGIGNWKMTDASNDVGNVPWTVFQLVFGTYAGPGASSAGETYNAPGADEAFTGNSETDNVIVIGVSGTLTVTSSNPNLVSVSGVTNTTFNVTSAASGNGFATITLTDSGTGASATYSVSVTTTTIPIASHDRR